MTRVAVLGTGLLGSGFVEGFIRRGGTEVVAWNRTRAKAEPLAALGATIVDTIEEAVANVDRVHVILLDDDTVDDAVHAMRGSLQPGTVIVDHTTTRPDRTAQRMAALDAAGIDYLHAPVMMGPPAAREARGIMMVAGPVERFNRVRDELSRMTGELLFVGERPDLAAVLKLCGNAAIISMVGVMSDVFHLADAARVDRADVIRLFDRVSTQGVINTRGVKMVEGDFSPLFHLEVARKDLRLMQETAAGTRVPMLDALATQMEADIAEGFGNYDMAVLGRKLNGE
jgi:3-hydroxyisobutyrate dehydrogenase-like beta-hydroxyacid dehydrogenase